MLFDSQFANMTACSSLVDCWICLTGSFKKYKCIGKNAIIFLIQNRRVYKGENTPDLVAREPRVVCIIVYGQFMAARLPDFSGEKLKQHFVIHDTDAIIVVVPHCIILNFDKLSCCDCIHLQIVCGTIVVFATTACANSHD